MAVGVFNDLYMYDPATSTWTDLTNWLVGNIPPPRYGHGFVASGSKLYVQGGHSINSGVLFLALIECPLQLIMFEILCCSP